MKKIKVLIIDDSALVRKLLTEILSGDPEIEVVGTAADPLIARDKIKVTNPDVLTLDIEMPKMDGLTFLANLMRLRPMPVVMVSTLTEKGADVTLRAMELGAIDYISKPKLGGTYRLADYSEEIIEKVKVASMARVKAVKASLASSSTTKEGMVSAAQVKYFRTTDTLVAIGASTGGTEAIKHVLSQLPANFPAIVISQHIPPAFSASFAASCNKISALQVSEAKEGEQILPGCAYIAPGGKHLMIKRSGARYICHLDDGPAVNRFKPSVDVMFHSMASTVGGNAVGVILTGMGADGAKGLKAMLEAGARTIGQDQDSSVVWGMPGAAFKAGAVQEVVPLNDVARTLASSLGHGGRI